MSHDVRTSFKIVGMVVQPMFPTVAIAAIQHDSNVTVTAGTPVRPVCKQECHIPQHLAMCTETAANLQRGDQGGIFAAAMTDVLPGSRTF